MRICFVGAGYVGLVTGTCFADLGNDVICVDNNEEKINLLKNGGVPIYEPGLNEMIARNVGKNRLSFTTSITEGVEASDIIFIAVNTPPLPNGDADLSFVETVSKEIAQTMKTYKLIVEKSTVPVETGEWIKHTVQINNKHQVEFDVASNPEFLREGTAVHDIMNPDRIVIGVESARAEKILRELYTPFNAPIVMTDIKSAELIKHASNSFLATKISFINAVANICERTGADIIKVAEGMGYDTRISKSFLNAGAGFGGSCFPKDLAAFIHIAQKYGYDFKLLKEVENINNEQKKLVVTKVKKAVWILKDKKIGILGLAFKPNTDDMRRAPAIDVIEMLQSEGSVIKAFDPVAMDRAKQIFKNITFCKDPYEVAEGVDCLVIMTEWNEFKEIDLSLVKDKMANPIIIDGRNIYDPAKMKELGFVYHGIGR
ncbi:MAG: UDP-glucose/GDP-mannose dehydrogenase family protein [bacterium]|nr:UDP-glucose/GDP-mannose dehydrogenase family protein [bacterium]